LADLFFVAAAKNLPDLKTIILYHHFDDALVYFPDHPVKFSAGH
jgi:hypothetical protein